MLPLQPLVAGTRVGRYEIVSQLGAGGMGVVYRARDTRLGRDVAVKMLAAGLAADPQRLKRFEQEARAVSSLDHPNVVAVHDVGQHGGAPFLVTECLEGHTLRTLLLGAPLAPRRVVEFTLQIARGLEAAHARRVIHRDLKPENLFVTAEGRIKILDFGLAKLSEPAPAEDRASGAVTAPSLTESGVLVGTVGYISPEQVRGNPADERSDLFAIGTVMYEMLSGRRAFQGPSQVETLNAILKEEPVDLAALNPQVPPELARIVRRSLEKEPERRYRSARDLAADLEALSPALWLRPRQPLTGLPRRGLAAVAAVALAVAFAAGYLGGRAGHRAEPPVFRQLTFHRGTVRDARFAPDGTALVYSAAWDGEPVEVFSGRIDSVESRRLGMSDTSLLAVSPAGEMALLAQPRSIGIFITSIAGTLARAPLAGGAPRALLDAVAWADWGPGGEIAVVRDADGKDRLEYPIGTVLHETAGWISNPRVAPGGDRIAFLDHPSRGDDGGWVAVVDRSGVRRVLGSRWLSAFGLAWAPGGREIWFTATHTGSARALHAVDLAGRERLLLRVPGMLTLRDVSPAGRVLLTRETLRGGIVALAPGAARERDLSWLDASVPIDLSADGHTLLFNESGEGGGTGYGVYLRGTDGSPAVRLGEGSATALSPDGRWALSIRRRQETEELVLLPTGTGSERVLPRGALAAYRWATFFPDGRRILVAGNEPGQSSRLYVQDLDGAEPEPVSPEGVSIGGWNAVHPDGKRVAARGRDGKPFLHAIDGAPPQPIAGIAAGDSPVAWSADGLSLFVLAANEVPARVYRVNIAGGQRESWRELTPADAAGITGALGLVMTPDGGAYAYGYYRVLSDLYAVEGIE